MRKKYFIFGGGSYIAKKLITQISKKNEIVCFSSKKNGNNTVKSKIKYIKTSYSSKHINQHLKKNINKNKKNIFLFFNGVSENKAFYKLSNNDITKIIKINYIQPVIITQCILKSYFFKQNTVIVILNYLQKHK